MAWIVEFADEFEPEFDAFPEAVQNELLAQAKVMSDLARKRNGRAWTR